MMDSKYTFWIGLMTLLQVVSFFAVRRRILRGEIGRVISLNYGKSGDKITIRCLLISSLVLVSTLAATVLIHLDMIKWIGMAVYVAAFAIFLSMVCILFTVLESNKKDPGALFALELGTLPIAELIKIATVSVYWISNF